VKLQARVISFKSTTVSVRNRVLAMSEDFLFRKVRGSRDRFSWIGLGLSVAATIFGCLLFFRTPSQTDRTLSTLLLALFFVSLFWFLRCLLLPFEWELVVETDLIRWGRVDRPNRQQKLFINQLVRLVEDPTDNQVLADVGKIVLVPIGLNVLMLAEDRKAFLDFMREKFPRLPIEKYGSPKAAASHRRS
jgi:hypothetical protein